MKQILPLSAPIILLLLEDKDIDLSFLESYRNIFEILVPPLIILFSIRFLFCFMKMLLSDSSEIEEMHKKIIKGAKTLNDCEIIVECEEIENYYSVCDYEMPWEIE